jgi:uncharacterized protein
MKRLLLLVIFLSSFSYSQQDQKFINVIGSSELIKKADQMNFNVYIKTVDESIEASKILNDKYLVDLLIMIKEAGIRSEDTEISPLAFGKNYDRDGSQKGYYTQTTISFLLKDLEKYYYLSNKLSSNNAFEISAEYSLSKYEQEHREAYVEALKAAREKAEYMTAAMNMKLGEVLEIEELTSPQALFNPLNVVSKENAGDNITGNVNIKRSVRVKFALR